jgi:AraC-like DNA-binding protein
MTSMRTSPAWDGAALREHLAASIDGLRTSRIPVQVARPEGLDRHLPGHFVHSRHEFFVQISGQTQFDFPSEQFTLHPGRILVVPAGLPHAERLLRVDNEFLTVVLVVLPDQLTVHLSAEENPPGKPTISYLESYATSRAALPAKLLELLVTGSPGAKRADSRLGETLALALLTGALEILRDPPGPETVSHKVAVAKRLVSDRLQDCELSVKSLAKAAECTPDYLSYLFHQETEETLKAYVSRLRLERATNLLRSTNLTAAEIAWRCGFRTPAYFSRVFKQRFQHSPGQYRAACGS